jgi:DNA-binding protein H-NS
VRKWEYKKIVLSEATRELDDVDVLCDAGEEGWELVAILANGIAYLKREVTQAAAESTEQASEQVEEAVATHERRVVSGDEAASAVTAKYRDPMTGETWSGRGRMAGWLKRKVDAGEDVAKYRV